MSNPYPPIDQVDVGGGVPTTNVVVTYDPVTYQPTPATINVSSGPIFKFKQVIGRYPGNNKQWWVAKADADDNDKGIKAGDFLPDLLETFYSGNNRAPRGHYVLNQFRKDRTAVSGVPNIPIEEIGERPNSVTFFSGRAWFGCQSTVYYSQILDSNSASKAGLCYQEADPTAEDISDLIASDGGVVPLPEADHIEALCPLENGVVVFAQNGVWFISGGDSAFSALNISVSKISPIGTKCPKTIVETDGTIFWWSEIGIQALQQASGQFGPIAGKFGNTNIAESTVQSFFNDIGPTAKHYAKGIHDTRNNVIVWLYNSNDEARNSYDRALLYDLTLQAFYPWSFSDVDDASPRVTGVFMDTGYFDSGYTDFVTTDDGASVVDNANNDVTVSLSSISVRPSNVTYLTRLPDGKFTISKTSNTSYVDWQAYDGVGKTYSSYIITGYELMNDAMRNKQITYLFAHFRRTDDDYGNNLSSCKFMAKWDWAGDTNPRRWSTEIEAYRPRTYNLTDVVVSKNKVRGHGKSVQFRFGTDEADRNFDLLGWSVGYTGVTQP